ncbi:hypothetical protein K488DRAFT_17836, partial [Vararia minispora EC-137]
MEFRLLTETPAHVVRPILNVDGKHLVITDSLDFRADMSTKYVCISYVWGEGRRPNPLFPQMNISDHTLAALNAAVCHFDGLCDGFWIDAFCVPTDRMKKAATLASMRAIYGRAAQIAVVLTPESFAAFHDIASWDVKGAPDPPSELLDRLEKDPWIRSVWTYQEVVNGPAVTFISENKASPAVDGLQFLNKLGHFIFELNKRRHLTPFDFRQIYPSLDAFQDLLVDWHVSPYLDRSTYQVMSCLQRRRRVEDAHYFYSMIGTIAAGPICRPLDPTVETLADAFMTICEDKGDYSFVFASNKRDTRPGLTWRPTPGILHAVLPWSFGGELQPGSRDSRGVL